MGLNFEFATATKIVFGTGKSGSLPHLLKDFGRKILLVTGKHPERHELLVKSLQDEDFEVTLFAISQEPLTHIVSEGVDLVRQKKCTAIAGVGGGSAIDGAKAVAALAPNEGNILDYLEVIGRGRVLKQKPLPFVAVPTTAGTGAEVTKNAVIHSPEHQVKVSLRSDLMFPLAAVTDPALTLNMPQEITAATGMDALTHLIESFVSNQANPYIDILCREGIKRISASLETAFDNGSNLEAREDMAFAALLGGMALANVKLGAVHGFAGPMGGMYPIPHGTLCASLLTAVLKVNYKAVENRNLENSITKYHELGRMLTGNKNAVASDGIKWVERMVHKLKIPAISSQGVGISDFPLIVAMAKNASSMKGNPVVLNDDELYEILENAS